MNSFDIKNYYQSLMEKLLQCTADDFGLTSFYDYNENLNYKENQIYFQMFIEFIYRCLKSSLLKIYASDEDLQREGIKNIEHYSHLLTKLPLDKKMKDFNRQENVIWFGFELCATKDLKAIAQDCDLVAYEDDVDFSTEKGQKFRDKIEKVWADNGLRWDLEHPLFPVPLENVATTDEQREEDRETEVGQ